MSERLHREIEEILSRLNRDREPGQRAPSGWKRYLDRVRLSLWGSGWDLSPEGLLTTAIVLIVAAFFLGRFIPRLGAYLAIVAVVLFAASVLFSVTGWHRRSSQKRWRGRVIDNSAGSGLDFRRLLQRLRGWFR